MMKNRVHQEKRNKRIGILASVAAQIALLILLYFIVAWKEPSPPIPEYGIELGFSTSAGATLSEPSTETTEPQDADLGDDSDIQDVQNETQETTEGTAEQIQSESQNVEANETQDVTVSDNKSAKASGQNNQVKEQKVDERSLMGGGTKAESENAKSKEKENKIEERALYGSQGADTGTADGASLSLAGWIWDFKPEPDDQSDQTGKIVYKIIVDQDGYLVKIETITSTVSPAVERKYRQAVEKLTFSKTADYKTASLSAGTITFIIKSK